MTKIINLIILGIITLIVVRCANSITSPVGGPKDLTAPTVLQTTPANGSANFTGDKFSIRFDEYIKLENVQQSALISPPMKELPDFRIKGKSLLVKFNEELKTNTTYSVYFGDAITDITEGNPVSNFTYIFSTGDFVDSLSLYGTVSNSFDLLPVEGAFVMLYKDNNDTIEFDSLPYYVVPYYLSKTDINGNFQFSGLSEDNYLLFSMLDQNSNIIFDQPGEKIAFLDTLIQPFYIEKPIIDTTLVDTITEMIIEPDTLLLSDSIVLDSTILKQIAKNNIDLYMFLSPDTIQRLLKAEVLMKNKIRFSFSQPALDVNFKKVNYPLADSLVIIEYSEENDTIIWHLNNPPGDSLELLLTQSLDTLGNVYLKLDPSKKSTRVRKKDEEVKEYLTWKSNVKSNVLGLNEQLEIEFSQPMVKYNNLDSSLLIAGGDSIWGPDFSFTNSLLNKITIPIDIIEDTKYSIFFPDSAFTNWNKLNTQSIDLNFKTLPLSNYGIFFFHLHPEYNQDYIIQLLDNQENLISETTFRSDTTIVYEYLTPAEYKFKIIFDDNRNSKWDPGNFGIKLQPEKVIYFPKDVKVRGNWELEEDWEF